MIRRLMSWTIRQGSRLFVGGLWRLGRQAALDSALGTAVDRVPKTTQRAYRQVFNISTPTTVYVRGSHCQVTVQHGPAAKVTLDANLHRAFGVELVAEQDEAGIYIIARRKAVVGQVTRVDLILTVPADCHLAFHLTPGEVTLAAIDGVLELPTGQIFSSSSE